MTGEKRLWVPGEIELPSEYSSWREYAAMLEGELHEKNLETLGLAAERDRLRHEKSTDDLTGLMTRGAFMTIIDPEIVRYQRDVFGESDCAGMSLAMLDLDHFGEINNRYGHLEGDGVLGLIANYLRQLLRGSDICARYGGEEFVVLMRDTSGQGAYSKIDSLRGGFEIEYFGIRNRDGFLPPTLTFSGGIAALRPDDDRDSLIKRADDRLYKAKKGGRNRVVYRD